MSDNQKGQSSQGESGQSTGGEAKAKGAPDHPPATPPNQRTNSRKDGRDGDGGTKD